MKNKPNLQINIGSEEIAEAKKRKIIVQDTETQENYELHSDSNRRSNMLKTP